MGSAAQVLIRLSWLLLAVALPCAGVERSHAERHAFVVRHPCPSTGMPSGSCPGWIVDHIIPLCAGGPDKRTNMQWQTVSDAKAKDREEYKQCRQLRGN
jgi:hypothetical protein